MLMAGDGQRQSGTLEPFYLDRMSKVLQLWNFSQLEAEIHLHNPFSSH